MFLRKQWKRWHHDTHELSFNEYLIFRFKVNQEHLTRLRIKPYSSVKDWLETSNGV